MGEIRRKEQGTDHHEKESLRKSNRDINIRKNDAIVTN